MMHAIPGFALAPALPDTLIHLMPVGIGYLRSTQSLAEGLVWPEPPIDNLKSFRCKILSLLGVNTGPDAVSSPPVGPVVRMSVS
jgi:hypothetical protein